MAIDSASEFKRSIRLPHPIWLLLAGVLAMALLGGLALYFHPTARIIRDVQRMEGSIKTEPGSPDWLRALVDDKWLTAFERIREINLNGTTVSDDWLALLAGRDDLELLDLGETAITDNGVAHLRDLPNLWSLNLCGSDVGDNALANLKNLPRLRYLPMGFTHVTDASLVHLREMPQLDYIGFRNDNVTDAGLVHLEGLQNLTGLYLGGTRITDAGLQRVHKLKKLRRLYLDTVPSYGFGTSEGVEPVSFDSDQSLSFASHLIRLGPKPSNLTQVSEFGIARLLKALPDLDLRCTYWADTASIFPAIEIAPDSGKPHEAGSSLANP